VLNAMLANDRFSRPDDYVPGLADQYQGLSLEKVQGIYDSVIHPERLTWVIVGDAALIRESLEALQWAPIQSLDADGNALP
jgi:hypothetical protein